MKRMIFLVAAIGSFAAAYGVFGPLVTGRGVFEFAGGHGGGRASFEVNAARNGKQIDGRLLFSAEGIHIDHKPALSSGDAYPDIVLTAETLNGVDVLGNVATIRAKALLHREPVVVTVTLTDSRSTTEPDQFSLRCDRPDGAHLFHVEGLVFTGEIDVR